MNHLLFTGKMKLADVLMGNYRLLLVLDRFRLHLGFGEKSVEEVCMTHGIPAPLFLMVCNVYTFGDYLPGEGDLKAIDVRSLLGYLQSSHHYYKEKCLPGIRHKLDALEERTRNRSAQILQRFYSDYQAEVMNHFDYEEFTAFPYVMGLMEGRAVTEAYSIGQFEKNHSNIEEKLNDMKSILIKYLPDTEEQDMLRELLFDLFELEDDFRKHTLMEDKVLVPLVEQMDRKG